MHVLHASCRVICWKIVSEAAKKAGTVSCILQTEMISPQPAKQNLSNSSRNKISRSAFCFFVACKVLRPAMVRIVGEGRDKVRTALQCLESVSKSLALQGCKPLRMFDAGAVQIKMLDPIFHEEGDRPLKRGMEASATKQLQRKLNQERRAAARQLARDATVVQQLQSRKQEQRRVAGQQERKRVRQLMEVEKQELKQMATEFDKSMNTMFGSYSKTKERKKANRREQGVTFVDCCAGV